MESGIDVRQLDRFFKLVASVVTLVTNGKRNVSKVCDLLQKIVSEVQVELYLFGQQKTEGGCETGLGIEKHLMEEGLIERAFSLEDEVVKGWIANPATYPEEFRGKVVFLWKSTQAYGNDRLVEYLAWSGYKHAVVTGRRWLYDRWYGNNPALLKPKTA